MNEVIKLLKKEKRNEWVSGVIPGLLLHMCLGFVYCWSLFKVDISNYIEGNTSWAFSIMVFTMAITAILSSSYVERRTKDAARYGAVLFSVGLIGSGLSCQVDSLLSLYLSAASLGMGSGLIYDVPLKILSKWFRGNTHGYVGTIFVIVATLCCFTMIPITKSLMENYDVVTMFSVMGLLGLGILMLAGYFLDDPDDYRPLPKRRHQRGATLKYIHELPGFWVLWILFFINLSCGLAVISCERDMLLTGGIGIVLGMGLSRLSNPLGKGMSRFLMRKHKEGQSYRAWLIIFSLGLLGILVSLINREWVWLGISLVSFGYGASFAIQPEIIRDLYGPRRVSRVYPLLLTAWAGAGLFGNRIGAMVYENRGGITSLLLVLGLLYIIGIILTYLFKPIHKFESKD